MKYLFSLFLLISSLFASPKRYELLLNDDVSLIYWEGIRPDVKMLYDPVYNPDQPYQQPTSLKAPQEVPDTSGIVTVLPHFWEVLELVTPYTNSLR